MNRSRYEVSFRKTLNTFCEGLADNLQLITGLSENVAAEAIAYLVQLACESQNIANISLARQALSKLPPTWLVPRIHAIAEGNLDLLNGEWECRRLLELYLPMDASLARTFAETCLGSRIGDVAAVGREFLTDPHRFVP